MVLDLYYEEVKSLMTFIVVPVVLVIIGIMTARLFSIFKKNKSPVPLYLGLSFLANLIAFGVIVIVRIDYLLHGPETLLGPVFNSISHSFNMLSIMFIFRFQAIISGNRRFERAVLVCSLVLIAWIILPVDEWLGIVFITYIAMWAYAVAVYLSIIVTFLKAHLESPNRRFVLIAVGSLVMLIFTGFRALSTLQENVVLAVVTHPLLLVSILFLYWGYVHGSAIK